METNENHALTKAEGCYHCKPLVQQRNELAAQVERLRYLFNDLCSCNLNSEYRDIEKKIRNILSEQPPAALSALKAQWQAEAITEFMNTVGDSDYLWDFGDIKDFSIEYIQRLQEPSNANPNNPPA